MYALVLLGFVFGRLMRNKLSANQPIYALVLLGFASGLWLRIDEKREGFAASLPPDNEVIHLPA